MWERSNMKLKEKLLFPMLWTLSISQYLEQLLLKDSLFMLMKINKMNLLFLNIIMKCIKQEEQLKISCSKNSEKELEEIDNCLSKDPLK